MSRPALISNSLVESELLSTLHDRERREQRQILKVDLLRARRFGMVEDTYKGRLKYTLAGKVFIYDPRTNKAVTSFETRDKAGSNSGSKFVDPVMIHPSPEHEAATVEIAHERMVASVINKKHLWKSHTVLVVDMSGSMRTDDVDGARCRSDAVWTCIARDFVKGQLDKESTTLYDLVSVVIMRDKAEVLIRHEPTDWVLYNKLVGMREWTALKPEGHGYYKPALEQAHALLRTNDLGSCALSLFFFSDGKPSEPPNNNIIETMGSIASRFGRRLSVCCVGMAGRNEDFSVLEKMVLEAKAFGAIASFNRPSLDADSLSHIISSHVTSLTSTKTELTEVKSGKGKIVRTDIVRERADAPEDTWPTADWRIFRATPDVAGEENFTNNIWKWNKRDGNFCQVMDRRCFTCFQIVADQEWSAGSRGKLCQGCRACYFCNRCIASRQQHDRKDCLVEADKRRKGAKQKEPILSYNVAWKRTCFGEGAERVAFKFRFLDPYDDFIGPVMVAKESRFIEEGNASQAAGGTSYLRSHRHSYHLQFMTTQALASRCAETYNERLDEMAKVNPRLQKRIKQFPRIRFLEPLIFELSDGLEDKMFNVLVEPFIEGTYKKYNSNFGNVAKGATCSDDDTGLPRAMIESLLGRKANIGVSGPHPLHALVEESEDEESSDDEAGPPPSQAVGTNAAEYFDHLLGGQNTFGAAPVLTHDAIPDEDFAHAFSHFSYHTMSKRSMVVDLQGALKVFPDGRREFLFTDPAVHSRKQSRKMQGMSFGRTNLGEKGMKAFFETHKCNDACRFLGLVPESATSPTRVSQSSRRSQRGFRF